MPELPPWLWFSVAGILLLFFLRVLNQNFRRRVRYDFIQFLRERYPQFQVLAEREHYLLLRHDGSEEQIFLQKLYAGVAGMRAHESHQRRRIFTHFIEALMEHQDLANRALELEKDGDKIMPRLAPPAFVSAVGRKLKEELPHTPVAALGLAVVYVLDAPESVVYLTRKHLGELGLDLAATHERALSNLERKFTSEVVREALTGGKINVVKTLDSYDAARILLVPKFLKPGESVAAAIPDRDTLVLCAVPRDDNWSAIVKLARTPAGETLLNKPIKISPGGFELV